MNLAHTGVRLSQLRTRLANVVRVAANRSYGSGIRPAFKPQWLYSSLGHDLGVEDLLVRGLSGSLNPVDR